MRGTPDNTSSFPLIGAREQSRTSTPVRVAFVFWMILVLRYALTVLFFQEDPKTATFLLGLISGVFALWLLTYRFSMDTAPEPPRWPKTISWIKIYLLWAGISLVWTFSSALVSAAGYYVLMVLDIWIIFALLLWTEDRAGVVMASMKGWVAGALIIDLIALLFTKGDENGRLGNPDFLHPTYLGHLTAIAGLFSIFFWQHAPLGSRSRLRWAFCSIVLWWFLIQTMGKTALVSFICAALFLILKDSKVDLKTRLRTIALGAIFMLLSYGLLQTYIVTYVEDTPQQAATLTGRTILWMEALEMTSERPLLGYGFLSFRDYGPQDWDLRTVHAHNEWITQAFQLGAVGLVLAAGIYWSYFRYFRTLKNQSQRRLGLTVLIYVLLEGMTIAEPFGLLFPLPLIILMTVELPQADV